MQETDGSEGEGVEEAVTVEKQTNSDRLQLVSWDENKTWEILQKQQK